MRPAAESEATVCPDLISMGWLALLGANSEVRVPLDVEDWQFFFGTA